MIDKLNTELSLKLRSAYEEAKQRIESIKSDNPFIQQSLQLYAESSLSNYRELIMERIKKYCLDDWKSDQSEDGRESYDCLYFEYSDQELPPAEAFSYAYSDTNFKITIDGYCPTPYGGGEWQSGSGIILEPFIICKPFHYEEIDDDDEYDALYDIEENDEHIEIIETMAWKTSALVLNEVFNQLEEEKLLDWMKLRSGGKFVFDLHDNGGGEIFYLKK